MLFMVIEHFKPNALRQIGERFQTHGRLLPPDVIYHASWIDAAGERCFQVMEAPDAATLDTWISHWDDLAEFEVIPVQTSDDFWAEGELK
jgi:hypothetical protein